MSEENVVTEREPWSEPFSKEEIDAMDLGALREGLEELLEELPMEEEEDDDEEEKEERGDWRMHAREALWDLLRYIGGPPPEEEEEEGG